MLNPLQLQAAVHSPAVLPSPVPCSCRRAGHAAAQINPPVPFWRIKPSAHTNGIMR